MNKEIQINYVKKSNEFVGIRMNDGEINIYVPQVFRKEENYKKDILLFLNSLSLTEKIPENIKEGNNMVDNIWPINSYLWIIRDYLENGFYYKREKSYVESLSGKIEWKRTLKQVPLYSNGNIIYNKLITSKMAASEDLISHIYKLCLKQSINKIGWLYDCNFNINVRQVVSNTEMITLVQNELNNTFDDVRRMRFNHMLKIIKTTEGDNMISNSCTYGIKNYYYVFETMVDSFFGGIIEGKKDYFPNGYWILNDQKSIKASNLRPDTILKKNGKTYILDAKMYQFGVTHDVKHLPKTQSIQKQITYGDYVFNTIGDEEVRNVFILPYDKKIELFLKDENTIKYNDNNLAYFGEAHVDWRDNEQKHDHDYIYAYGIDFNHLLRNYNTEDNEIITTLCSTIEERIQEKKSGGISE